MILKEGSTITLIKEIMNRDYSYKETDIDLFVKQECKKVLKVALIALLIVTIILSIIFSNQQIALLFMIASSIIIMTLYITFLIAYIRYAYRD